MKTPTKLPRGRVMVLCDDEMWYYEKAPAKYRKVEKFAVIPFRTAKQARAFVSLMNDNKLLILLDGAARALEAIPVSPSSPYWNYRQREVGKLRAVLAAITGEAQP